MKKIVLLMLVVAFFSVKGISQTLYSATVQDPNRFNPGLSQASNPKVVFDDILIPSATVGHKDSLSITKVKVGIRRLANAPAVNVSLYYTPYDDTATMYNTLIKIPPVFLGTVNLPANGAAAVTEIVSLGDSVNTLFKLKVDTGNVYTNYFAFFLGVGLSNTDANNGLRFATGAPNDDVIWIYNGDSTVQRYATTFSGTTPVAQFYMEVFGRPSGPFPVELSDFTAHNAGTRNMLSWSTVTESNNVGFDIQRSADGKNFSSIGKVASKAENGTSAGLLQYSFTDANILAGTNYYRLKQTDKDGKFTYSNIVTVKGDIKTLNIASVYPNPAREKVTMIITAPAAERVTVSILDINGKTVKQLTTKLVGGDNLVDMDINSLAPGSYFIRLANERAEIKTAQFIKN